MKVKVFHRETIKPSSPTPQSLRSFKLSLMDQYGPVMYTPLVLFYPIITDQQNNAIVAEDQRSDHLRKTLSETQTHFYPLAGRIRGISMSNATMKELNLLKQESINCSLSKFLENPDPDMLREFLAIGIESEEAETGSLLVVQATFFECGGMAIGLAISHKLTDAATLSVFLNTWASTGSLDGHQQVLAPEFGAASLRPPLDVWNSASPAPSSMESVKKEEVCDREIKCSRGFRTLCFLPESEYSSEGGSAMPGNIVGNLVGYFSAKMEGSETHVDLRSLVAKAHEELKEYENLVKDEEIFNYCCSSWCRFRFYEADLGWGKPTWVSIAGIEFKNTIVLMDSRDGSGIEAWLMLKEEDMVLVESNKELLAFASLNPRV
ncbi:hypothetical protein FEM48_Zijuj07G0066200 [Ziziphus jujuba var. spinosa]|uniref:Vinorine synthase-like n=1 Tax=Ziziphus jujuba var. spinosa TaxID=714518 RepID=A0A978V323_ZIZJJ|nr:hypothetical protein FEM48_Zijuj07G0066200 [Ziziphus jujuba var. spinosa]